MLESTRIYKPIMKSTVVGKRFSLVPFLAVAFWIFPSIAKSNPIPIERELPFKFISFLVKDAKSEQPLSEGREDISFEQGFMTKATRYWAFGDSEKKLIQEETCSFQLKSLRPRSYKFHNFKTGEFVSLSGPTENSFADRLQYKELAEKPEVSGTFLWQPGLILGKTLHHGIVRAWSKLHSSKFEPFPLYLPMKRNQYLFRAVRKSEASSENSTMHRIALEPDNWAVRQLTPPMFFYYAEKNNLPTLVRYEGPTTVVVDKDSDRKVIIEFAYDTEIPR